MRDFRKRKPSTGEEIGNAITHGVGFFLSLTGAVFLLIKASGTTAIISSIIFSFGMIFLYLNSTLYHSFRHGSTVKSVYKRFDHISIYILISATFAPLLLIVIGGKVGLMIFIIQWILTIMGIVAKAIWPTKLQILHIILFLFLGWSGVFFIPQINAYSHQLVLFIGLGGLSYTIGVLFYALIIFKYHHFVWHFFVLGGTILHFLAIYLFVI